jgi:hypothetical protein
VNTANICKTMQKLKHTQHYVDFKNTVKYQNAKIAKSQNLQNIHPTNISAHTFLYVNAGS